jgi:hypothetical protein
MPGRFVIESFPALVSTFDEHGTKLLTGFKLTTATVVHLKFPEGAATVELHRLAEA